MIACVEKLDVLGWNKSGIIAINYHHKSEFIDTKSDYEDKRTNHWQFLFDIGGTNQNIVPSVRTISSTEVSIITKYYNIIEGSNKFCNKIK